MTNEKTDDKDWLLIGRIVGAHGLDGYVKVKPESDFPERFEVAGDRWLRKPDAEPVKVRLVKGRYLEGKNQYLVKLDGVNYRDQAEDLRSAELLVEAGDRLTLEPGEFHVSDLIGLQVVVQADNSTLGKVSDVYTMGHDMLEVTLTTQDETPVEETDANEKPIEAEHDSMRAKAVQKLRRQKRKRNKKKAPKTLLIPFVEEIVPVVEIESGRIEITPPPGLIEL